MSGLLTDITNNESRAYAERLHDLFLGADHRHGLYRVLEVVNGKAEIKDENGKGPEDVKGPPTVALWEMHLASNIRQLGVSPLRADGMCRWGVIDVDDKGVDFEEVVAAMAGLPILPCRSKSGRGGHGYFFADVWVPQAEMNAALKALAARLPYKSIDIFPPANGPGNWVCMPYGGGENSDRYAAKAGGLAMSLPEFLHAAEAARCSLTEALRQAKKPKPPEKAKPETPTSDDTEKAARKLKDYVTEIARTQEGGRAKLLYGRAKDMGKMIGAGWIEKSTVVGMLTGAALACGLTDSEAEGHIENGIEEGRQQPPPDDGDGGGGQFPDIDRIVVLVGGEEDEWRLTLRGWGDITLPVREVMHFYTFNVKCAARLGAIFDQMKQDTWYQKLRDARDQAEFEQIPETETPEYEMRELLRIFLTDKHKAESLDEVMLGKPYLDEDEGRRYFRFRDFQKFLLREDSSFGKLKPNVAGRWVRRAIGKENLIETKKMLKGKPVKVHYVPAELFDATPKLPLPKTERPPI
ncbi:UNVERIFIED_ORG: hypothetical protein GGI66_003854 [Rhizobium esperanzae]